MGKYKDLDISLKLISNTKEEYFRFREITVRYFEGQAVFEDMPDCLREVILQWEEEQLNRQ